MTIKYVVIGIIIVTTLLGSSKSQIAAASTGFTGDNFESYKPNRPAINPDFDPDESCLFDVYQVQCIPGSEQECPENFGNNDDATCFPMKDGRWICPNGYHTEDGDETGQCYPNNQGCMNDFILLTNRSGGNDRCADQDYICNEDGYRERDYCIEYCNENPGRHVCKPEVS